MEPTLKKQDRGPSTGFNTSEANFDENSDFEKQESGFEEKISTKKKNSQNEVENKTGMPDNVKQDMEKAFGTDFSDVSVKRNSRIADKTGALALTKGNEIHISNSGSNLSNNGSEKLLAHELTHVVQQRQGHVPTSYSFGGENINDNNALESQAENVSQRVASGQNAGMAAAQNLGGFSSFSAVQLNDQKNAVVVSSTYFFKNKGGKPAKGGFFSSKSAHIGNKLAVGKTIKVDFANEVDGHYKAFTDPTLSTFDAFIPKTDVIKKNWIEGNADQEFEDDDVFEDTSEQFGNISDMFDKIGESSDDEVVKTLSGFFGGFSGLLGMVGSAKKIKGETSGWKRLEAGLSFFESTVTSFKSISTIIDSIAKAKGNDDGVGKSDVVTKVAGVVDDAIGSIKSTVKGIIGVYKLFKSKSSKKGTDALVTLKEFTSAALSAAKIAKGAYEVMDKTIPDALKNTIPGLSLAFTAIDLVLNLIDAIQTGRTKNQMEGEAKVLRAKVGVALEDAAPAKENKATEAFETTKRGTFPRYKHYLRVKKEIQEKVKEAFVAGTTAETNFKENKSTDAEEQKKYTFSGLSKREKEKQQEVSAVGNIDDIKESYQANLKKVGLAGFSGTTSSEDFRQFLQKSREDKAKIDEHSEKSQQLQVITNDKTALLNAVKTAIKTPFASGVPGKVKDTVSGEIDGSSNPIHSIAELYETIRKYEFTDKMSEINQKRQTSGWTNVILDIINIGADIATLSGVGAAVGMGIKAGTTGYKMAHSGAKYIQKKYRDRDPQGKKSSKTKHKEYVNHAKYVFSLLNSFSNTPDDQVAAKLKDVEKYVRATGVNIGLLYANNGNPGKQAEMLVEAMKKR